MKKTILLAAALLSVVSVGASAHARHVQFPGFHDHFTVNIASGIPSVVQYQSQTGTVKNDGQPVCGSSVCTFAITDNNWLSMIIYDHW